MNRPKTTESHGGVSWIIFGYRCAAPTPESPPIHIFPKPKNVTQFIYLHIWIVGKWWTVIWKYILLYSFDAYLVIKIGFDFIDWITKKMWFSAIWLHILTRLLASCKLHRKWHPIHIFSIRKYRVIDIFVKLKKWPFWPGRTSAPPNI